MGSFGASLFFAERWAPDAPLEVCGDIFWAVANQSSQLDVRTTLSDQAIPADAGNAALDYSGIFLFGEKCFQLRFSDVLPVARL